MTSHSRSGQLLPRCVCIYHYLDAFGREVSKNLLKVGDARTILPVSLPVQVIPPTSTLRAVRRMTKAVSEARNMNHAAPITLYFPTYTSLGWRIL